MAKRTFKELPKDKPCTSKQTYLIHNLIDNKQYNYNTALWADGIGSMFNANFIISKLMEQKNNKAVITQMTLALGKKYGTTLNVTKETAKVDKPDTSAMSKAQLKSFIDDL